MHFSIATVIGFAVCVVQGTASLHWRQLSDTSTTGFSRTPDTSSTTSSLQLSNTTSSASTSTIDPSEITSTVSSLPSSGPLSATFVDPAFVPTTITTASHSPTLPTSTSEHDTTTSTSSSQHTGSPSNTNGITDFSKRTRNILVSVLLVVVLGFFIIGYFVCNKRCKRRREPSQQLSEGPVTIEYGESRGTELLEQPARSPDAIGGIRDGEVEGESSDNGVSQLDQGSHKLACSSSSGKSESTLPCTSLGQALPQREQEQQDI